MDCNGAFTFAEKKKDDGQQSYFMHLCRLYGTIAIGAQSVSGTVTDEKNLPLEKLRWLLCKHRTLYITGGDE